MSDDLMERFPDDEDDADQTQDTGDTDTTEETNTTQETSETESTRSRSQYPMYLNDDLQDELNTTFERFNAQRTLDDEPTVEKHKDFLEAIVSAGLDANWEEYIDQ